ncbi:MAG: 5-formyltetrahydrofolate cyclo-ligase, partial [Proteobacteria bacterium]|nr:5-formyltetrahydrofolate cyclo-ligase [Pseudomonadota bacterium]
SVASPADAKAALRRVMLERRRAAHRAIGPDAAQAVADFVCAEIDPHGKIIAGYWPLGDELDSRPVLEALAAAGAQIALPVAAGQGHALAFRQWNPGDALEPGPFGTKHPSSRAPVVTPQILLVPLIAFDLEGHRLGYGAGYYDRTIAAFRAHGQVTTIGLGYDAQRTDTVHADSHDQALDCIVTNAGALWFV